MKPFKLSALMAGLLLGGSATAAPLVFIGQDVGNPALKGSVTDVGGGSLSIVGGGNDIWGTADNFYYYFTWAKGQTWSTVVQVQDLQGPDNWTKCELMVRWADPTVGPRGGDPFIASMTTRSGGQNQISPQYRSKRDQGADGTGSVITPNYPNTWLKLTRANSVFTIEASTDGVTYTNLLTIDTASSATVGTSVFGTAWPDDVTVGVAVTAHNDGDATGGVALISNLQGTFPAIVAPTVIGATAQPTNITVTAGSETRFYFVTTNNADPNVLSWPTFVTYQWSKNGQPIAGATTTRYRALFGIEDNNAQITCRATIKPPYNTTVQGLTSDTAVLTVNPGVLWTNGVKVEMWANNTATMGGVESGDVGPATRLDVWPSLDNPGLGKNNYINRMSGWFVAPVTTNYVFYLAADDATDLFLSTDSTVSKKRLIAQESGWTGTRSWLTHGGGGSANAGTQMSSETWSPDGGTTVPGASGYPLTAGQKYYLEVVHVQGGGGDNVGVTYRYMGEVQAVDYPTNGAPSRMTNNLVLVTTPITTLTWTAQPTNTTVFEGFAGTFYAGVAADGELNPVYQWYRAGAPVAGATDPSYAINPAQVGDSGAQVFVVAATQEGGYALTSSVVTLTVQQAVFERGVAKNEVWVGTQYSRGQVENGTAGAPTYTTTTPKFEASVNNEAGDDYIRKVSGLFMPPTTGEYVFFVNSDDGSDLYISSNSLPTGRYLICQETSWSDPFNWLSDNGYNDNPPAAENPQKRSDKWSPGGGATPYASGIHLVAGQKYYMEVVETEGGGGDNVEVTYKLTTENDPVKGADSRIGGNLIGINAVRANWVAFTLHPSNTTVAPFGLVTFTASGNTDSTLPIGSTRAVGNPPRDSTNIFVQFQWQKNGVDVAGATDSAYTVGPVIQSDDGAIITCKMRALGYVDNMTSQNPVWSNSAPATLTLVPKAVFEPGLVQYEFWGNGNDQNRAAIEAGTAGTPTMIYALPAFEAQADNGGDPPNHANNYGNRLRAFFIPPAVGEYNFFLDSDDDADLFVNPNGADPAGKRIVAQETAWSSSAHNWMNTGGGTDSLAQRRSDQFVDPNAGAALYPNGMHMLAGQKYFIEAVHHEGGGGDYVAVTAKTVLNDPVNGEGTTITDGSVGFYAPRSTWVNFTQQPQNVTANVVGPVTFTAQAASDSTMAIGAVNPPIVNGVVQAPTRTVLYQWQRNGVDIAGATTATYTFNAMPADNGVQFICKARGLGYADNNLNPTWSNSQPASLIYSDSILPTLAYAAFFVNTNTQPQKFIINIAFSEYMDSTTLSNVANYVIPGVVITNISVSPNHRIVELAVSTKPTLPLSLTVSGVKDIAGNQIAANSPGTVNAVGLTCTDIGTPGSDPALPTDLYVSGANAYVVVAEGSDIWNNADGFNFLWEQKSGSFDVVVRQKSITHTSQWAKGGLMIRESLAADSREWNIVNDPASADGIMAPDNSGYGANVVECNYRPQTAAATTGWDFIARDTAPAYPNAWVRLARTNQLLFAYYSSDAVNWRQAAVLDVSTNATDPTPLANTVYVGICTTAHNNDDPLAPPYRYQNVSEYADYNSSFVPAPPRPVLTVTRQAGSLSISWTPTGGHLESSPAVSGPGVNWQSVGTANPANVTIGTGPMFFRVVSP